MMTGPWLVTTLWTIQRTTSAFTFTTIFQRHASTSRSSICGCATTTTSSSCSGSRLFSSSSPTNAAMENGISRLGTLLELIRRHGVPGSRACYLPNDMEVMDPLGLSYLSSSSSPSSSAAMTTPELIAALTEATEESMVDKDLRQDTERKQPQQPEKGEENERNNLHPYLIPLARSKSSGNLICAYRNPFVAATDRPESTGNPTTVLPPSPPWPIVEAQYGGPGMQLLALNSEHLMRRIVCECDGATNGDNKSNSNQDDDDNQNSIELYNQGLGQGLLREKALDTPYQPGSVKKLGYGVDKYVLLRVGPFPDLYQSMARQHAAKGDEQSSLIAAETANGKLPGFGSNFVFYSRLLSTLPNRREEARDAARMCLRLPLPTMGLTYDDFKEVALLADVANKSDSITDAMEKMKAFYEKIREVEREDPETSGKTSTQVNIEEANYLIDRAVLDGTPNWPSVRSEVAAKFRQGGLVEMADFVECR